jgi:hypothetical protein
MTKGTKIVRECRKRMASCTPEQRKELEIKTKEIITRSPSDEILLFIKVGQDYKKFAKNINPTDGDRAYVKLTELDQAFQNAAWALHKKLIEQKDC